MADATVCLTYDFDAVSSWLHSSTSANTPTNHSRGLFGADMGAPRILDLLDKYDLPATWFVPGHTVDSFPTICEEIHSCGHEIAHHGWSHTRPSEFDSRADERADIERGNESIRDLIGERPAGYRSPSWDFSKHTLSILEELDFEWDSSGMATDFVPYRVREDWHAPLDGTYDRGTETDIVEVPVSWQRDDYPAFAFDPSRGFANERAIFRMWCEQFEWMYDHLDGGVFVLTMHPQVTGQSHRLTHLEDLLQAFRSKPNVRFRTVSEVATEFSK